MLGSRSFPSAALMLPILLAAPCGRLVAQEITARVEIQVTDASGAPVDGARAALASASRGLARAGGTTDGKGRVLLLSVPPAPDYVLEILRDGYLPYRSGGIALQAGRRTVLEASLRPAGDVQRVEVRPDREVVDTSETRSVTSWTAETIENLPLLGRHMTGTLTLAPGVTDTDLDGNANVQGARETGLQYRLDGGDITDPASGSFGMNLDFEIIEELEMLSAGASVAYGRADGGFANVITRSGGNDIQGSLRLAWRTSFLDGPVPVGPSEETQLDDFKATATLGGPILRDRLWYFVSAGRIDATSDLRTPSGDLSVTNEGWNGFAKISWQPRQDHRLSLQVSADPRRYEGLFDTVSSGPESASDWMQGGTSWQARWTHIARPDLILEASLSGIDSGISTEPVSSRFHPIEIQTRTFQQFGNELSQAVYPLRECSTDGTIQGFIPNCDPRLGPVSISTTNLFTGRIAGPSSFDLTDDRERLAMRNEITASLPDAVGEHLLGGGLELSLEEYTDTSVHNAYLLDATQPCPFCRDPRGQPVPNAVTGTQTLVVPEPRDAEISSEGTSFALFLSDSWKPLPNLSINAGLRLDVEEIESEGRTAFSPASQRRRSVRILTDLCDEGLRLVAAGAGGMNNADTLCDPAVFRPFYGLPASLIFSVDPNTPRWIRDLAGTDMVYDASVDRVDGDLAWRAPLINFGELRDDPLRLHNRNLSPRVGIAWDPWSDGRTRLFGSWGRYHDRVFLGSAALEARPVVREYTFQPDPFRFTFLPGQLSFAAPNPVITQVDRDLRTPRSDVLTLGAERELAPGWSAGVTYTQRLAFNLHQDRDSNHATCLQLEHLVGVEPAGVCTRSIDPNGVVTLGDDLFGAVPFNSPNGLTDLYALNPFFGRVLIVENAESVRYRAWTLELRRRRFAGWDLSLAYTYSRAKGGGMSLTSVIGDDPTTRSLERGHLDIDQRHRVIAYGTATLPRNIDLGWAVRWESGVPYSRITTRADQDDVGGVSTRIIYRTGDRNDQRTPDRWIVDARVAKHFLLGPVTLTAELAAENLLDDDTPIYRGFAESRSSDLRLPGRRWEAGLALKF